MTLPGPQQRRELSERMGPSVFEQQFLGRGHELGDSGVGVGAGQGVDLTGSRPRLPKTAAATVGQVA